MINWHFEYKYSLDYFWRYAVPIHLNEHHVFKRTAVVWMIFFEHSLIFFYRMDSDWSVTQALFSGFVFFTTMLELSVSELENFLRHSSCSQKTYCLSSHHYCTHLSLVCKCVFLFSLRGKQNLYFGWYLYGCASYTSYCVLPYHNLELSLSMANVKMLFFLQRELCNTFNIPSKHIISHTRTVQQGETGGYTHKGCKPGFKQVSSQLPCMYLH